MTSIPARSYVFKRNSQRFLRFGVRDAGDPTRCQVRIDTDTLYQNDGGDEDDAIPAVIR
jgi:hypothetical protein